MVGLIDHKLRFSVLLEFLIVTRSEIKVVLSNLIVMGSVLYLVTEKIYTLVPPWCTVNMEPCIFWRKKISDDATVQYAV